ncbi:hypothetical protein LPTSP2_39600, partial [Leptospira ellinghausenii]
MKNTISILIVIFIFLHLNCYKKQVI